MTLESTYERSVHKNFKIERAVTKIVTNATSVNATGASSGAFPICMYPHDHVFHVNFSNEETFEDVLDKLETMNQKQLMFFVSTRSALRDRIQNKYSQYSMNSTHIEKKMTMPAHKYLSQLGHGEVVVNCFLFFSNIGVTQRKNLHHRDT